MKTVKAVVRPQLYEKIAEALAGIGVVGVTATDCLGYQNQTKAGAKEYYRGVELDLEFIYETNLDIVVEDGRVNDVIEILESLTKTAPIGDGNIIVRQTADAIRIRDGQHGTQIL